MDQKKLHKTIESIASGKFTDEQEMLINVLEQIVYDKSFNITGGRIWKLVPSSFSYKLLYQTGLMEKIDSKFKIRLRNYPEFDRIAKEEQSLQMKLYQNLKEKEYSNTLLLALEIS
jgi:sigma-B regulation protein RsbU (phosphoserine phosphatase)